MARPPLVVGNWKMNLLRDEALLLSRAIRDRCDAVDGVEKLVCPPYVFLHQVKSELHGSSIEVGSQDVFWEEKGAYTGEVSVTQVAEVARYALIGHSERRQYFGETDETVNRRLSAAVAHGLRPIVCVGELLAEREAGRTEDVIVRQVRDGFAGVTLSAELIVAYEPVWAIGTGLAADGATAQEAVALIRATLRELGGAAADEMRILYGGSVIAENAAEFMAQPDIDGALVGGASLKADSFALIMEAAVPSSTARA